MQVVQTRARHICTLTAEQKAKSAEKIKKMQKDGEKLVKGIFEFVDAQGGWLDFSYRFYPGEPISTVKITHGEIVDIPLDLARHLNNCYKKVRCMPQTLDGAQKNSEVITKISRTRFIPMDMVL